MNNPSSPGVTRQTNTSDDRAAIAADTLKIVEAGYYTTPTGSNVGIGAWVDTAKSKTRIHNVADPDLQPEKLPAPRFLSKSPLSELGEFPAGIEVENETAGNAIRRLSNGVSHVACLNFASAKNPGGGFLRGARAQEEDLALSSALYACLQEVPEFYQKNRALDSSVYLDLAISSPQVPFFRDDQMATTETVQLATIITCPAPNATAILGNEPARAKDIVPALERRIEMVLAIARTLHVDRLILGAWGCGIFGNDPNTVARLFKKALENHKGAFEKVVFAAYDKSIGQETIKAFQTTFDTVPAKQPVNATCLDRENYLNYLSWAQTSSQPEPKESYEDWAGMKVLCFADWLQQAKPAGQPPADGQ